MIQNLLISRQDVIHDIAPQAEDWEIRRELSLLEADEELLYRPFDSLSNDEQTKILIYRNVPSGK